MAKIYETIDDVRRDDLKHQIHDARVEAKNASALGWITGLLGFNTWLYDGAKIEKKFNFNLNLKMPTWLEKFGENAFVKKLSSFLDVIYSNKMLIALCGVGAALNAYLYFSSKNTEKKAQAELDKLGVGKEVIKLPDGSSITLPQDADAVKSFLQDEKAIMRTINQPKTAIQANTTERSEPIQNVEKSLA